MFETPFPIIKEMVVVQLAQSLAAFITSLLAALGLIEAQRQAHDTAPMTWRSEGRSTGAPAVVTLRLGSR